MQYAVDDALVNILFMANYLHDLDPKEMVKLILLELNVSVYCDGWGYLCEAIIRFRRDTKQNMTKELYPAVAACIGEGVNREQVERSIRTAIHKAWIQRDDRIWKRYFSITNEGSIRRPTNGEFISRIAATIDIWTCCSQLLNCERGEGGANG